MRDRGFAADVREEVAPRVDDPAWAQEWEEPAGHGPLVPVSRSWDQMGRLPVLRAAPHVARAAVAA